MSPRPAISATLIAALLTAGCTETRYIYSNPPLAGMPGAVTRAEVVGVNGNSGISQIPDEKTVTENPDGTVTLRARNVKQVLLNVRWCLENDRSDVFVKQVLATRTGEEYQARGKDPAEAFAILKRYRDDFDKLHRTMPMGEFTPGLFLKTLSANTFRLEITDRSADRLYWNGIDVVFEKNNYLFRWVVTNPNLRTDDY